MNEGQVGPTTRVLGFAGLLPQAGAVGLIALGRGDTGDGGGLLAFLGGYLAVAYGAIILSFLGGIWWGFATRRAAGQGALAAIAVAPSLVGVGLLLFVAGRSPVASGWPAVLLGSAILLTLVVDRHLVATGEAPAGWMGLRVPLSVGLGGLTILAGVLLA